MRPYVRSLMQQAHENGTPVMRTMFYEFPDDPVCWELKDQYMFGSDLLVAPIVYKDAEERVVYLPAGESWTELHTGKVYPGGQTIQVNAPLEVIPVFARGEQLKELIGAI